MSLLWWSGLHVSMEQEPTTDGQGEHSVSYGTLTQKSIQELRELVKGGEPLPKHKEVLLGQLCRLQCSQHHSDLTDLCAARDR